MRIITSLLLLFTIASSCHINHARTIKGNGEQSVEERAVNDFRRLEVSGPIDVEIAQGASSSVRMEGDRNLLKYIRIENEGKTLEVYIKRGYRLKPRAGLKIYITSPVFEVLSMTGSGSLLSTNTIQSSQLTIDLTGSGDAQLSVDAPNIKADLTGSGSLLLSGRTREFSADLTGSSALRAYNLLAEKTDVEVNGSGDAEVFASKKLDADLTGSGNITYRGTADIRKSRTGPGEIRKLD